MSNTIPTSIVDKNGKPTTVHRRTAPKQKSKNDRAGLLNKLSPQDMQKQELTSEYVGDFLITSPDHLSVKLDYALLSAMAEDISYTRNVYFSHNQINAIGKAAVGDKFELNFDLDSPKSKIDITLGQYRQILDALVDGEVDESMYTEYDAYNAARNKFFQPSRDEGWVPSADDTFEAAWDVAVEYGRKKSMISDTEHTGRGRTDMTWDEKETEAARLDAGIVASTQLGIPSLEPTGDIRRDWHEVTGRSLVGAIGGWLTHNRISVSDRYLGGLITEFLGDDWDADISALESDRRTPRLVNVRDLRELFAEIAVSKGR